MLYPLSQWNLQNLSLFLEPDSFFIGKHLSMVTFKTFFLSSKLYNIYFSTTRSMISKITPFLDLCAIQGHVLA